MKDIKQIQRDLDELYEYDIDLLAPPTKPSAKHTNRARFLQMCVHYLETKPSEAFLKKELERINTRIYEIIKLFNCWATEKQFDTQEKKLSAYRKEMGIIELEKQVDALKFLID